jgi:rod shape-determining protein MreD
MKRPNQMKLLRIVLFVLEILLLFFIGDTEGVLPSIAGARPSLLVGAAVSVALSGYKELPAMSFGIFCGLLMDFSRGGPYGFYAILLAILCYFSAALVQNLFQKNLLTAVVLSLLAVVVVFSLQWVFFYLLPGYSQPIYALLHHALPSAVYTFLACIPIYFLTRGLSALCSR